MEWQNGINAIAVMAASSNLFFFCGINAQ